GNMKNLVEEETKQMIQNQVDYMTNRELKFWVIYEKPLEHIRGLLDGSPTIKKMIDNFAKYKPSENNQTKT
ncbi:MAG: hypothetical protein QG670_1962, partial [Thermoproteota archaeon]|nr:hypothetical protein [Thermoproteota archaeon]